jgi:hypothetical protein
MFDLTSTTNLICQLTDTPLQELRELHGRLVDAEPIVRAVLRQREQQERRNQRLRQRGLAIVCDD